MKRPGLWLGLLVVLVLVAVGWFLALPQPGRGSTMSRGAEGWLAARLYLEARGAEVELLDRSPEIDERDGVLVEVFPWRTVDPSRSRGLRRHLARGGTVVMAYSGGFDLGEDAAFEALGLPLRPIRDTAPLNPLAWRADTRLGWRLLPEAAGEEGPAEGGAELALPAPSWAPRAPQEASVTYRAPGGEALVFATRRGGGRVVVLPAAALANASLAEAGNADLLEGLYRSLGSRWAFDENAHGLVGAVAGTSDRVPHTFDLLLVHLAVLYLLVVLALSRRFGPAWRPQPAATGSVTTYLTGLGRLHDRLGHHAEAARKLTERWQELHPRLAASASTAGGTVGGGEELVARARFLARRLPGRAAVGTPADRGSGILPADLPAPAGAGQEGQR